MIGELMSKVNPDTLRYKEEEEEEGEEKEHLKNSVSTDSDTDSLISEDQV